MAAAASSERCPYCHADVVLGAEPWVVCRTCVARHHRACWGEAGRCAACGGDVSISDRAPGRWLGGVLVTVVVLSVVAIAGRAEVAPEQHPTAVAPTPSEGSPPLAGVPVLVQTLASADATERRRAADALGAHGRHAAAAVEPLAQAACDPDPGVRLAAVRALDRIGLAASPAAPVLVDALLDPRLRDDALAALRKLDLRVALPRLAALAARDDGADVRSATAVLLRAHVSQAIPLILEATEPGRERPAAASISDIGTHAFPAVVGHLAAPAVAAQAEAVLLAGDADMAVAALIDALSATAPELRDAARGVLRSGGARWVRPALRALRSGGRSPTRREDTFAAIGPAAALPVLIDELSAPEREMRAQAAYALATLGPEAAAAIPALSEAILRGDAAAVSALRGMGAGAARAAPALAAAVLDPALALRAVDTALALGPDVVAPVASDCLVAVASPHATVRDAAQRLLRALGADHAAAVPALADGLSHAAPEVRVAAARALARVGPRGHAAVPALLSALSGAAAGALAGVALTEVGTSYAVAAVPALTRGLEGRSPRDDRLAFLQALAKLGPQAAPALPALCRQVVDDDAAIRLAALRALIALGDSARAALPELELATFDADPRVREAATQAAARLPGGAPIGRAAAGWRLRDVRGGGAEIAAIVSGGPAARAGLHVGDRIVGVDANRIEGPYDLLRRLAAASPGERWRLDVARGGDAHGVQLELGAR